MSGAWKGIPLQGGEGGNGAACNGMPWQGVGEMRSRSADYGPRHCSAAATAAGVVPRLRLHEQRIRSAGTFEAPSPRKPREQARISHLVGEICLLGGGSPLRWSDTGPPNRNTTPGTGGASTSDCRGSGTTRSARCPLQKRRRARRLRGSNE
eukprot:gene8796-biopygen9769